ncbi:hypothetical protein [Microcystis aeruginosa]|uniref:hypothetical protein n=1 Tax=Microcystis aeruginosa TaxID=1126 RepID=UPI00147AB8F7|nr:hypothetical protein [Microcystis aeruginosa]
MSSIYSAGASRGSGGVFLTFLGLIALLLPIKSDFSQFHRFFSPENTLAIALSRRASHF